jgi:hypothetical protein
LPDVPFPKPDLWVSGRKRWKRRTRRVWVAAQAGEPPPPPLPDDEVLEDSNAVRRALGDVSHMWIHRHSVRAEKETAD